MEKELLKKVTEKFLKQVIDKAQKHQVDFTKLEDGEAEPRRDFELIFRSILKENRDIRLTPQEQEEVLGELISEILGLGPINKLLKDPDVLEIMVNGPKEVYVEKGGRLEPTDITFRDEQHLEYFIEKIVSPMGRHVTELEPYIDSRLKDGSRVNIVRPPASPSGSILTIRKFSRRILNMEDLINLKTLDNPTAEFLKACVASKLNILISGGSSSGKTTLLNVLASFIPEGERAVIIEDTREIHLSRSNTIFLEARPPSIGGKGEITIRELLKNSLHMRPDRIIVGEVRSDEVLDMIQAMNTGHEGSMTTLHANSSIETLDRLEVLALLGGANISSEVVRRQLVSALDLIIHLVRYRDGTRKITQITQISEELKTKEFLLQDIFILEEETGKLKSTGRVPTFYPKLNKRANYYSREFGQL